MVIPPWATEPEQPDSNDTPGQANQAQNRPQRPGGQRAANIHTTASPAQKQLSRRKRPSLADEQRPEWQGSGDAAAVTTTTTAAPTEQPAARGKSLAEKIGRSNSSRNNPAPRPASGNALSGAKAWLADNNNTVSSNKPAVTQTQQPLTKASQSTRTQPPAPPSPAAFLAQQPPLDLGASDWSLGPKPAQPINSMRRKPTSAIPANATGRPASPCPTSSSSSKPPQAPSSSSVRPPSASSTQLLRPPSPAFTQQRHSLDGSVIEDQQQPERSKARAGAVPLPSSSVRSSINSEQVSLPFQGPGLSVMSGRASHSGGGARSAHEAEQEASLLRAEVATLKEALGVWQAAGTQAAALPPQQESAALQRYRAQIWQQQRQVSLMGAELKARAKIVSEADAILQEVCGQLDGVVEATDAAGGDAQVANVLVGDQALALGRWAKKMQLRLRSERARSSKSLTRNGLQQQQQQAEEAAAGRGASDDISGMAPTWEVPFIPAGGNRFLAAATAAAATASTTTANTNTPVPVNPRASIAVSSKAGSSSGHNRAVPPSSAVVTDIVIAKGHAPDNYNTDTNNNTPSAPHHAINPLASASSLAGAAVGALVGGARLSIARLAAGLASLGGPWFWGAAHSSNTAAAGPISSPTSITTTAPISPPHASHLSANAAKKTGHHQQQTGDAGGVGLLLSALIACPELCASLEGRLTDLAPKLCALAVQLRVLVLPAMPWLSMEAANRVQVEVAESCSAVAAAASALWELSALLPTGGAASGDVGSLEQRGAEVGAGRDSWLWAAVNEASDDKQETLPGAGGPASTCGVDVDGLLAAALPLVTGAQDAGISGKGGAKLRRQQPLWGGGTARQMGSAFQQLQECVGMPLRAVLQAAAARQALLEDELHFCCRATALQSEHVKHLIASTEAELQQVRQRRAAQRAAEAGSARSPRTPRVTGSNSPSPASSPQQAPCPAAAEAAAALQELLNAQEELERSPGEVELAALVALFHSTREALQPGPGLLLQQQTYYEGSNSGLLEAAATPTPDIGTAYQHSMHCLAHDRERARQGQCAYSGLNEAGGEPHQMQDYLPPSKTGDGVPWATEGDAYAQQMHAPAGVGEAARSQLTGGRGLAGSGLSRGGGSKKSRAASVADRPAWES